MNLKFSKVNFFRQGRGRKNESANLRICESANLRICESTSEFLTTLGGGAGFVYSRFSRLFVYSRFSRLFVYSSIRLFVYSRFY